MDTISVNTSQVCSLADHIFEALAAKAATHGLGICASALALGRLMAPRTIDDAEEIAFVQACIDWCGMYWSGLDQEGN